MTMEAGPIFDRRIRNLACWRGDVTIEPLKGGLSNQNFLVKDAAGSHVVRFGSDYPFHHVSRRHEQMAARAAHEAGFAPAVEHTAPGVMVTAYLGATTLTANDVRAGRKRIATLMRGFHDAMPRHVSGEARLFWPFHVIRDYARTLEKGQSRMREALPRYLETAASLEAEQVPLPIVFGHNDLLPANFLDDGDRLWLIDFEYAGFSTAMFDLAGTASNAGFTDDEADELLAAYFERPPDAVLVRAHRAMQCASLLREAMWSMVSELHLDAPGVDYVAYTAENLERFEAALDRFRTTFGRT
jgi:thiamine kinase-like enzyme